jgi:hypothetical protein
MTIVSYPEAQPPAGRGPGRPKGSRGNGRTAREKIARIENATLVRRAEIAAQAQEARDRVLSEVERRRAGQSERVFTTYEAQESKRSPQFQIDQRGTLLLLIGLAVFTFLTTAALTADGTIGASISARFAFEWMGYLLFGAFEVAILAFMLMYYVRGSRIDILTGERMRAGQWFFAMVAVSALTVGLSAYHVMDLYDYEWSSIDMWFGIGIRLAVSTIFVLVAKGIAGVLFARALDLNEIVRVGTIAPEER